MPKFPLRSPADVGRELFRTYSMLLDVSDPLIELSGWGGGGQGGDGRSIGG